MTMWRTLGIAALLLGACAEETDVVATSQALSEAPVPEDAGPFESLDDVDHLTTAELTAQIRALKAEAKKVHMLDAGKRARFDALARARAKRQSNPVEGRIPFDPGGFVGDRALSDPSMDNPGPDPTKAGGDR